MVAPVTAQADEPTTADEFLDAFRELEDRPAFETYSEFEVIRSQAITEVQVGEFSADDRERMSLVLAALRSFDRAHELADSGSAAEGLAQANRTRAALTDLREAGGSQYAVLGTLALDRFYEDVGQRLHERAEAAEATPRRLSLLGQAATAYQRAGAADQYSELTVQRDRLRAEYEADLETIDESVAASEPFLQDCEECTSVGGALSSRGVGVFDAYADARTADRHTSTALDLAERHDLADRQEHIADLDERAGEAVASLAIASAIVALGYALAVAAIAGLVGYRLASWKRDYDDAHVGEIILAGEVVDG